MTKNDEVNRIVTIVAWENIIKENIDKLIEIFGTLQNTICKIYVKEEYFSLCSDKTQVVVFPTSVDTLPKAYNYILDSERPFAISKLNDTLLHIIDSNVEILKDPTEFISELEDMMIKLDYHIWFNTVCDKCNFVYQKYNPRITVQLDAPEFNVLRTESLSFTSNANTAWMVFNLTVSAENILKFDNRFTIPMYYIIEFLARRRNTRSLGSLYYMNQYLTVKSELGTFRLLQAESKNTQLDNQEKMAKENVLFMSMNINNSPDNIINVILENLYEKLLKLKSQKLDA